MAVAFDQFRSLAKETPVNVNTPNPYSSTKFYPPTNGPTAEIRPASSFIARPHRKSAPSIVVTRENMNVTSSVLAYPLSRGAFTLLYSENYFRAYPVSLDLQTFAQKLERIVVPAGWTEKNIFDAIKGDFKIDGIILNAEEYVHNSDGIVDDGKNPIVNNVVIQGILCAN